MKWHIFKAGAFKLLCTVVSKISFALLLWGILCHLSLSYLFREVWCDFHSAWVGMKLFRICWVTHPLPADVSYAKLFCILGCFLDFLPRPIPWCISSASVPTSFVYWCFITHLTPGRALLSSFILLFTVLHLLYYLILRSFVFAFVSMILSIIFHPFLKTLLPPSFLALA